jgi:predicted Zn-ribbon and HTH transcriptional regulator
MNLPASHRRSLSVTARIVEDSLDEIEKVLMKKEKSKSSHRITESFDETARKNILDTIAKVRESNEEMFHALHLEPNVFSETQIVRSRIVHLWAVLRDSKSKGLRRFGELPADAAAEVDSRVDKLLSILKELL